MNPFFIIRDESSQLDESQTPVSTSLNMTVCPANFLPGEIWPLLPIVLMISIMYSL